MSEEFIQRKHVYFEYFSEYVQRQLTDQVHILFACILFLYLQKIIYKTVVKIIIIINFTKKSDHNKSKMKGKLTFVKYNKLRT